MKFLKTSIFIILTAFVGIYAANPTTCPEGMQYIRIKIKPTLIQEYCMDQYEYPNSPNTMPLVNVSWYKAEKLCNKQGKRLCSDKEWEEACKGCNTSYKFSYGDEYDRSKCVTDEKTVFPSGAKENCKNNYKIFDMIGNVAEWTNGLGVGTLGGSHKSRDNAECSSWEPRSLRLRYADVGFRCCKTLNMRRSIIAGQDSCPKEFVDSCALGLCDKDHDGVSDSIDVCPTLPEDHDGFQDSDGCPDLDNDNDGILDAVDKCPDSKEDFDSFQDDDGCPDYDNDNDGIPDLTDRCPDMPGPAPDGCPQVKAPPLKLEVKKAIILRGINFQTNSAEFTPESYEGLGQIYQTLRDYPEIYVEVRGYTDNVGGDEFNVKLSDKRANAVRDYLISQGIDPYRITANGFGKKYPVATNRSAAGRAENRRVELYRVK